MLPATEGDELLAQRGFLRRLARGLLGDDGLAEDVVQEVELRALARGPRPGADLRAWLATVTRRLALNRLRSRERRTRHERAAARPEALPGADAVLIGLDLQQSVLAAVRALEEPYRTAIWLRYYEDLAPGAIATRLGVPLATVKTRLRRGLHALRARLDAAHGDGRDGRAGWALALLPLARSPLGAGSVTLALAGGFAMKKLAVAVALVLLAWFGGRWWSGPPSARERPLEPAGEASLLPVSEPDAEVEVALAAAPAAREPAAAADSAPPAPRAAGATLLVRVRWESDGAPAAGIGLTLWPTDARVPELGARQGETDADGRATFAGVAPGRQRVFTDRGGEQELELAEGEQRELELVLPPGLDVEGRVVDARGDPVAGAEVWLEGQDPSALGGRVVTRARADGGFRLRALGARQALSAFAPGFAPALLASLHTKVPAPGEHGLHITLVLERAGHALRGRVQAPDGAPVAGALVAAGTRGNWAFGGTGMRPRARVGVTDARGAFDAGWIDADWPGGLANFPVHVLAPGFALARVAPGAPGEELLVTLTPGATVEGFVRDAAGAPLAAALVAVERAGEIGITGSPFGLPSTRTDGAGGYLLEHVPPSEIELIAGVEDALAGARETRVLADGARVRWDLMLSEPRAIRGRVLDATGAGLAGRDVLVSSEDVTTGVTSGADGAFVFAPTEPGGAWDLVLIGTGGVLDRRSGVPLGAEVELVERVVVGTVRGTFVDRAGLVPAGERCSARLACVSELLVEFGAALDGEGAFVFEGVVPGRHQVVIECAEVVLVRSPWFELAEGEQLDLGTLETRAPGAIAIECALPAKADAGTVRGSLANPEGDMGAPVVLAHEGGVWRAAEIVPGRYRLQLAGAGLATHLQELEIRSGEELHLALALVPGVERRLAFVPPAGASAGWLRVELRERASGRELVRQGPNWQRTPAPVFVFTLAPGTYDLRVTTDTGLAASGSFEVVDLAPVSEELRFDLR
jgi:RNA polymerase sigma-70 factor (ECF subfamily)